LEIDTPKGKVSGTLGFSTLGTPANFGDYPGRALEPQEWDPAKTSRPQTRFGKGSKGLPVVRPAPDNLEGCHPHFNVHANPDSFYTPRPPYLDTVLLVKRGNCTFFEKLLHAERAGARGVIVTSPEAVAPSLEAPDQEWEYADMYLKYAGLVLISGQDVTKLELMMDQPEWTVMVEVIDTQAESAKLQKSKQYWDTLRLTGFGRPLYINGKRLHNAVLLF